MDIRNKLWMWGYTQTKTNVPVPFSGTTPSHCSLESAASYFGMPNTVFMNTMHTWEGVEQHLDYLKDSQSILCALPHGRQACVDGARRISELSLNYPAIKGVVLDDFAQLSGHDTPPELVREIKRQLVSANPALELYVVIYSDGNHLPLEPYLEWIDGIMLWRWISTETFWKADLGPLLHRTKVNYGKKLLHGVYLQNYGEHSNVAEPMDFDLWKRQWMRLIKALRSETGFLDGCVLLQNAWVGDLEFRDHVVWLKDTLDWLCETTSIRS